MFFKTMANHLVGIFFEPSFEQFPIKNCVALMKLNAVATLYA